MVTLLTILHVLVALVLILVVLLQSSRGTDLAGAFGGAGSQTAFGPRGTSNFLSRTTAILAAVFMVTALTLSLLSNHGRKSGSVLSGEKAAPAAPLPKGLPPVVPSAPAAPGGTGMPTVHITPVQPGAGPSQAPAQPAPSTVTPSKPSEGQSSAPPPGK